MPTTTHTAYGLSNIAGCAMPNWPDSPDAPGARFLLSVQDAVNEADDADLAVADCDDLAHEIADDAVPVYTHERWQVFVELAAYNEDPTELGADASDMTQTAGVCLYVIAQRLAVALLLEDA